MVIVDDRELVDWLAERVPSSDGSDAEATIFRLRRVGDSWVLEEDGRTYVHRGSRSAVAIRLLERLNELACFSNPVLTVHSALVADGAGQAVWIPARSGGGKSTLAAQLFLSGMRYATDEVVTVSEEGVLTGWPKWLTLKRGSHAVLSMLAPASDDAIVSGGRWMVPPSSIGEVVRAPVVGTVIAFPEHRRGEATQVHLISKAEAVAAIVPQAFNLRACGSTGIDALASAVRRSHSCVRITYGDGWEASRLLIDLLRSSRGTMSWAGEPAADL